jgi:CrcB protein
VKKLGLIAALGAIVGSWLRYQVGLLIDNTNFPWATFAVNIVGAFLIGLFLGLPAINKNDSRRVFLITGLLGGFTTFSSLAVEALQLTPQTAILYVFSSFAAGLLATTISFKMFGKQS